METFKYFKGLYLYYEDEMVVEMFRKILFPTDFSEISLYVLENCIPKIKAEEVIVVHVIEYVEDLNVIDTLQIEAKKKIEEVVDDTNTKYNEPTHCNICNHKLEDNNSGLECPNPNCESKLVHRIFKATRKDALDIKGLGKAKIQALYDHGVLESIPDLYKLKNYREKLFDIPKFGEKTIDNLLGAINSTIGTVTSQRFIKSLNISPILGNNGAKLMIQNILFNSFKEDFLMMDLTGVAGFGDKSLDDWNSFIADADRVKEYTELVHLVKPKDPVYEGQGEHSQHSKQHSSNKTLFHISGRVGGIFDGVKTKIEMARFIEKMYPFLEYSPNMNKSVSLLFYDKPSRKTANILETVSTIEEFLKLKKRGKNTQNQWKIRFDLFKESLNNNKGA